MGNLCCAENDRSERLTDNNENYNSSTFTSQPVDRELLAAAAEKRLKQNNQRGMITNTVSQRAKSDLPEFGEATMRWQVDK